MAAFERSEYLKRIRSAKACMARQVLQRALSEVEFVDSQGLVNWLRTVKSPAELEFIRDAAAMADAAMATAHEHLQAGARECDVAAAHRMDGRAHRARFGSDARARGQPPSLIPYQGRTLADFMRDRRIPSKELAVIEAVRENGNEAMALFRTQSEANLRKFLAQPWVSIGSDASSIAPEGVHIEAPTHPRTYASFTKLFETYVKKESLMSLQEAVRGPGWNAAP